MNAPQLAAWFTGVTSLAIGLAFAYLWWSVLRQRYVLLIAVARLITVPQTAIFLLQQGREGSGQLAVAVAICSALNTVCFFAGCYELLLRRLPLIPFATLAAAMVAWAVAAPEVMQTVVARELPAAVVRGATSLLLAWLVRRAVRLPGRRPLAILFGLQGLHSLDYPLLIGKPWGFSAGLIGAEFNTVAISCFLFIALLDEARRVAEQADVARRETERRLQAVVSGAPVILFAVDWTGVITLSEGKALEAVGLEAGEVVGCNVFELYRDRPDLSALFRRALGGEEVHDIAELQGAMLERWIIPVRNVEGRVTGAIGVATDVTARVAAEAGRRQSEEKFAAAFRSNLIPTLITRLDDGLLVDVNDAFCTATGYARDDVLGRRTTDVLWHDPSRREGFLREMRTHGRVRNLEQQMRTKAGPPLDVLMSIDTIELGGVLHTLGSVVDITEQKRAHEALRQSEERFRRLVDELPVGVGVFDGNGRLLLENRAAREMLGLPAERQHVYDEVEAIREDGTPLPDDERPLSRVLRTHQPIHSLVLGVRARGGSRIAWVIENVDPQLDAAGKLVTVVVTLHDLTERREAEAQQQRLREAVMASAVDWTLTFDAVELPIWILGMDAKVQRLNAAARALAGSTYYSDAVGHAFAELGAGEPWHGLGDLVERVRQRRSTASSQVSGAYGHSYWYLTASPFTVSGEADRIIAIGRDVTDVVKLQESLRRTETMSALGGVVAGVAHEVRNPLFAISATVDALEARFGKADAYVRHTQTLRAEVDRLGKLMRDLLEYGRPPRLELRDGPVGPPIALAMRSCRAVAESHAVRLVAELADDLPAARLDASRMQQVFHNLIDNAVQHSPKGGSVTVRARSAADQGGNWIEVSVTDQGPGFRAEDLPHLFEPFFTRRKGGTGLGLSIVQRIVEQHGGEVSARNQAGGGAVTLVRLAAAGSVAVNGGEGGGGGKTRVEA